MIKGTYIPKESIFNHYSSYEGCWACPAEHAASDLDTLLLKWANLWGCLPSKYIPGQGAAKTKKLGYRTILFVSIWLQQIYYKYLLD